MDCWRKNDALLGGLLHKYFDRKHVVLKQFWVVHYVHIYIFFFTLCYMMNGRGLFFLLIILYVCFEGNVVEMVGDAFSL